MAAEDSSPGSPHSLKHKLRSSLCLSCCFPQILHHHRVQPRIVRSASLHSKSRSNDFPQIKEKCCNFIARIGRHHHHHRRHSADFHYDAFSYALNFEDEASDDRSVDDLRSFSARLPQSPPPKESPVPAKTASATVEIAALS
ncbi:hypothetical protein HN51_064107 [Arachis hypogaea]|uniref:Uncharacterized protein n=2 Tax=Arachis TaxID=3817 RepID=A0A445AVM5_ARAHY|nr:uncharacterized protein LOC107460476 [Arachis duranensis]XP_016172966.1 uncharacterized protein LOC107615415 [Arachis ipaensis]XP_025628887.1 uncharacterized protein LOC112722131 [Arachis hypogaea]XP_025657567.1 uncharacterized protein LOC112754188 [Arachis hypogaea]XP_057718011.1 uncharacterized protein LOC130932649 [Arachis stenosperma]QHO50531.1 uncharacterized protein DS421_1g23250 [Arachis hypogaea]RYR30495.1 hypothetical protein Ahy_B01g055253 [Arachis hypogaea]RYR76760.1 hypothetic